MRKLNGFRIRNGIPWVEHKKIIVRERGTNLAVPHLPPTVIDVQDDVNKYLKNNTDTGPDKPTHPQTSPSHPKLQMR